MSDALLVLISGPPGAGKTTLGAKLAGELGIPFINKHAEQVQAEELRANLERGVYAPLLPDGKALIVDTTDFARVDDQRLMQRIRAQAGQGAADSDAR